MDLTTATPAEIDAALYALYQREAAAKARRDAAWSGIGKAVGSYLGKRYGVAVTSAEVRDVLAEIAEISEAERTYNQRQIASLLERADAAQAEADNALLDQQPYDEEFDRRGRWTRAFLVVGSNGHVHSSMGCSTCFPTTQYHWVTEFSAHDEAEIVEAAGERACTVCYPSAPVDVLSRPTRIFTPDEVEKQRAREEREAKKAAAQAAQIDVPDYREYDSQTRTGKTFKTERAVTNAIAEALSSLGWYGTNHPSASRWLDNANALRRALEAKTGETYDWDAALERARKKITREGGTPKF